MLISGNAVTHDEEEVENPFGPAAGEQTYDYGLIYGETFMKPGMDYPQPPCTYWNRTYIKL
jgi:hypothetical protein